MSESNSGQVTQLLIEWSEGDKAALDKLIPLVHNELRRLARHYMRRERVGHTLQTTALVNEAYLRLVDQRNVRWQNRAHFMAIAAQLMRRILVDEARKRQRQKRGGDAPTVTLDNAIVVAQERGEDLIALDAALTELAVIDERKSKIVELRFFGGLSIEEAAEALSISAPTVQREWRLAKTWLYRELRRDKHDEP